MMKTIRGKLSLIFGVFMVVLVLCGILLNAFFLEKYYIFKNKEIFINTSEAITQEYDSNRKNILSFIGNIDRLDGISTIIIDENSAVKYNSFSQKGNLENSKVPAEITKLMEEEVEALTKAFIYTVVEKSSDQSPKLVYISKMNKNDTIILRKQMKGIKESVIIANQFYIFAGIIIMVIGSIFIFFFSKSISKPISEISRVAGSISNLDFEKRIQVKSQDEIGNLGRSINTISEKLSESIDNLRDDVERRKELVRNMSHELKTPIGVIKGYAEGLKYGVAESQEKRDKYCNVIVMECNRMDNMVRELLNLSMLESGNLQLNLETVEVTNLLENILTRFQQQIEDKGIKVKVESEKNILVTGDKELLDRAISNYVINAIHYAEGKKEILINIHKLEEAVEISVFNTGKIIPREKQEDIWGIFYKVDKARTRQYGGHGLGLAIVKLIMDIHKGHCGVHNVEGGVRFYLKIPQ